ncbi:type II toxin-antitoxin system VapC family toxin [Symmachiella dynata]|uniref:type II toxin-antitoxin system VapC family toxin n=1 Tax=Symmachiella dynata TaxID=2527995 RepID=UPI0018D277D0|nr:type II toxin-antitoxin system VapC family toxin [Symmachiella dynata]
MSDVVLDASAVLAYAQGERGADLVEQHLFGAIMSAVNYSEVLKKTLERGGDMAATALLLEGARIDVVAFDTRQATVAASLYGATKDAGLSFADRACLSLAITLDAPLYTADGRLADVEAPIELVLIRKPLASSGAKRKSPKL